ncbi:hypothetical protein OH77DRAFT_1544582 [Trametes cingulata]|nr:hypothetical protein OH77DRAFT_1544582 [Trametes cingulata]
MGGNQSVPKITKQDRAILESRDKVRQYQKKIQAVLDREHEIARQQLAAGRKDRALIALRKRKYQESLLVKTDAQLENLEKLVSTIEFSLVEVSVLHGLQQGNEVLKEIHKELNIENVERILEETAEAREYQREIDMMLAGSLSLEDEEAVQAELHELQLETLGVAEERPISLPSVPTTEPAEPAKEPEPEPQPQREERVPVAA